MAPELSPAGQARQTPPGGPIAKPLRDHFRNHTSGTTTQVIDKDIYKVLIGFLRFDLASNKVSMWF